MATVSTATPSVSDRLQKPPVPEDRSLAGYVDLATLTGWSFVASFAYPEPHFEFTYNNTGPTLDIGNGRVSRYDGDEQRVYQLGSVSGLSLDTDTVNYVFIREDNVIEVQDGDNPPGGDALLIGTVDTTTGTVETGTRGRSPISVFEDVFAAAAGSDDSGVIDLEAEDMADATQRFQREFVPDGEVCEVTVAGVMDASNTTTTGLAARVVDDGDSTEYHTTEAKRATGDPLARIFGPADLRFEIDNQSGGSVTGASGRWGYQVTPGEPVKITFTHWYKLDTGSGTTAVDSQGDADGNLLNSPQWTTDSKTGGFALDFVQGTDPPWVDTTADQPDTVEFSAAAWFKHPSYDNGDVGFNTKIILGGENTSTGAIIQLGLDGFARLEAIYSNESESAQASMVGNEIDDNTWHHAVMTVSGSEDRFRLYEDGTQVNSETGVPGSASTGGYSFGIGRKNQDGTPTARNDGLVDDVRIYEKELTASEVQTIYNDTV